MHTEAAIAQLGERQTEDLEVPGSIPGRGIFSLRLFELRLTEQYKQKIRTPGIEPGTIRYLPKLLQSNALPTELCPVVVM